MRGIRRYRAKVEKSLKESRSFPKRGIEKVQGETSLSAPAYNVTRAKFLINALNTGKAVT
jgi:hypothetical protein